MSLKRSWTLSDPLEIKSICRKGKKLNTKTLTFFTKATTNQSRFLAIIPKKKARKAVTRNLVRRWIYEYFRNNVHQLSHTDIVVFFQIKNFQGSKHQKYQAILSDLNKLTDKLNK